MFAAGYLHTARLHTLLRSLLPTSTMRLILLRLNRYTRLVTHVTALPPLPLTTDYPVYTRSRTLHHTYLRTCGSHLLPLLPPHTAATHTTFCRTCLHAFTVSLGSTHLFLAISFLLFVCSVSYGSTAAFSTPQVTHAHRFLTAHHTFGFPFSHCTHTPRAATASAAALPYLSAGLLCGIPHASFTVYVTSHTPVITDWVFVAPI